MSRLRRSVVFLALSLGAAALVREGVRAVSPVLQRPDRVLSPSPSSAAEVCLALAGLGAGSAGLWLGAVLTLWARDLVAGSAPPAPGGTSILRPRLVRGVLGATVLCAAAHPASAAGDLPLPTRPISADPAQPTTRATPATHLVRPGDSLWRIAAAELGSRASDLRIEHGWRRLYAANRARIGPDPDLLQPGTSLTLPTLRPTPTSTPGGTPDE